MKKSNDGIVGLIVFFILLIVGAAIGAVLWPYTINAWLVYFGKQPVFTWYYGALLGVVPYFGKLSIPLAVITWIAMMFLV